ncbi:MAG: hypothetical protein JWO94_2323 [Verrucomicrobiaceae bacterium]|nr:hypothetical protein [Verrucomicrobiaceae bacterium]
MEREPGCEGICFWQQAAIADSDSRLRAVHSASRVSTPGLWKGPNYCVQHGQGCTQWPGETSLRLRSMPMLSFQRG